MSKMANTSNILTNGVIYSTLKHTDGMCNEHVFRNGSFRELKIAKESNDLADLAKILPESYQKSNQFSEIISTTKGIKLRVNSTNTALGISFA